MNTESDSHSSADNTRAAGSTRGRRLRRYSFDLKRQIVEDTLVPGSSVSMVARRYDVNANLVFEWRNLYRKGRLGSGSALKASAATPDLLRIGVIGEDGGLRPATNPTSPGQSARPERQVVTSLSGIIEFELANRVKVRVDPGIAEPVLHRILVIAGALL